MPNEQLNIWLKLKDQLSRNLQGVQSRLKSFATSFKQHWIAITASITAAVLALRKAFELLQLGARAKQIEESFNRVAIAVGVNFKELRNAIRIASAETVNFSNIAGNVSALLGQGLNMQQIIDLMKVARAEARKMGQDTEQAFIQIANAVAGGFLVTVKRAYGLNVELKSAFESFAKTTGKTVDEVREYYKAQALANEIIQKAKIDLQAFNMEMRTELEYIQMIKARWLAFKEDIGKIMWKILGILMAVLDVLRSGFAEVVENLIAGLKGIVWIFLKVAETIEKVGSRLPKIGDKFKGMSDDVRAIYENLERLRNVWEETGEQFSEEAVKNLETLFNKPAEAIQKTVNEVKKSTIRLSDTFKIWEELAKNTATNIQNAFSNFFFQAFTRELNSVREIFAGFGRAMLQTISNILAQIFTFYAIIKPLVSFFPGLGPVFGITGGGGGGKQQGSPYIPRTGMYLLHKGEQVIPAHKTTAEGTTMNFFFNIQAWDSSDVWRNRKVLALGVAEEIKRNNPALRGAIIQYG